MSGTLKRVNHEYTSEIVVANSQYDVLLSMAWHVINTPHISYAERSVKLYEEVLPVKVPDSTESEKVIIMSMSAQQFQSEMRKKGKRNNFHVL